MSIKTIISLFFILQLQYDVCAQSYFKNWPKGSSPKEAGLKLTELFLASPHGIYNAPGTKPHIPYFEVCAWYGALTFAAQTVDTALRDK